MIRKYTLNFLYAKGKFYGKTVVPLTDNLKRMSYSTEAVSEAQAKFYLYRWLDEQYPKRVHCVRDLSIKSSLYLGEEPSHDTLIASGENRVSVFDEFPL